MKRDNVNYLAVGVFVITMGVALMVVLYQITGRSGPTDEYYTMYGNVAGIKYGTGVFYEGFQVGQVESIVPDRSGEALRYRVNFSVTEDWPIPVDSVAKIVASGLLSAVSLEITQGKSTELLPPGSEMLGQDQVNLFAAINDVAASFQQLSDGDLRPMLRNLNDRITELSKEYTELSSTAIRPLFTSLRKQFDDPEFYGDVKGIADKLNDSAGRVQHILRDENQAHISQILVNVENASANLNQVVTRIEDTRLQMNGVLAELDRLVEANKEPLTGSIEDIRTSMQSVSEHIDSVMYHLEGSSRNMHEFSRQIRENPGLLLGGSAQPEKETK